MYPPDNIDVQIARLEERLAAVTDKMDKITQSVDGLNKLAIQGRMAIIVLVSIGSVVGWFVAQVGAMKGFVIGR